MSDIDLVTVDVVHDWATGTLEGWLDGYTDPTDTLPQFKVTLLADGTYRVEEAWLREPCKIFKITINVEEVQ